MLDTLPLVFVLAGVVLYTVLAGADFGAGVWQLLSGRGERGEHLREHAHHSMGPVWEANHVWLIFVLTVSWTAYPTFLGSIASTLAVPFFIAGLGIILRGASYALRAGAAGRRELRVLDTAFAVASLVTPFALGAAVGGIASERVPIGNAAGHLFSSWLNPTSILIGVLAVAFSAYLAAVYLAADAARRSESQLEEVFRRRALAAGAVAGVVALAGLVVLNGDAHSLLDGLLHGAALAGVVVSALAGTSTLALVWRRHFEAARYSAAIAVATVIAGWAFARYPTLLPGLSVHGAAASHDTLVTLVVAVLAGGVLLLPSLGLLFALTLGGRLSPHAAGPRSVPEVIERVAGAGRAPVQARLAVALLICGVGLAQRGHRGVGARAGGGEPVRVHDRRVRRDRGDGAGAGRLTPPPGAWPRIGDGGGRDGRASPVTVAAPGSPGSVRSGLVQQTVEFNLHKLLARDQAAEALWHRGPDAPPTIRDLR